MGGRKREGGEGKSLRWWQAAVQAYDAWNPREVGDKLSKLAITQSLALIGKEFVNADGLCGVIRGWSHVGEWRRTAVPRGRMLSSPIFCSNGAGIV